jgi:hypothetical protein
MNYAESFDQFASKLSTTDLALYAGAGLILWVLFKDKLSPVQKIITTFMEKLKTTQSKIASPISVVLPVSEPEEATKEDIFFKLIVSWKQTRDLALKYNCYEAIKAADQMFPYLSPVICGPKQENKKDDQKI